MKMQKPAIGIWEFMKEYIISEKKLKRLGYEYPNRLDSAYAISMPEARRIRDEAGFPDLQTLITLTKDRYNLSDETLKPLERFIGQKKRTAGWLAHHKGLVAALFIALLLAAFFAFVPIGRTLAKGLFNFILRSIAPNAVVYCLETEQMDAPLSFDIDYIHSKIILYDDRGDVFLNETHYMRVISGIDEFENATGHSPIRINSPWLELDKLLMEHIPDMGTYIQFIFTSQYGDEITITQCFYSVPKLVFEWNNEHYINVRLSSGRDFLYAVNKDTGVLDGLCVLEDSVLIITAPAGADFDKVLALFDELVPA